MLCSKPFMAGNVPFGCGQCLPCRVNRRRLWSWRMFLESLVHQESCFVTLTYRPEAMPDGGSLQPIHLQKFLKLLRHYVAPRKLRFFACGEYGDLTWRPHYHAALFGVGPADAGSVEKSWPHGFVQVGDLNQKSAQYIAGYVVKKLTYREHPNWSSLYPEFARMSLKPGIGATALEVIAESVFSVDGVREFHTVGDVPHRLLAGGRNLPLGRYLRRKLRELVGMDDEAIKKLVDQFTMEKSLEVLALQKSNGAASPRQAVVQENLGRIRSVVARSKIGGVRRL